MFGEGKAPGGDRGENEKETPATEWGENHKNNALEKKWGRARRGSMAVCETMRRGRESVRHRIGKSGQGTLMGNLATGP